MIFKNPLVVGHKGEIGSFILGDLLREMPKALNIWCFDINESETEKIDRINKSDYIFLCIPIQDTVKWLIKYKKHLKNKVIIEQASLKEWIYNDKRIKKLKLIPMHILFRPSATPDRKDRETLLTFNEEALCYYNLPLAKDIKTITCSNVTWCKNIELHDKVMSLNQALVHKVISALGRTLGKGVDNFLSKKVKELANRILDGDKDLYKFIQTNKYLSNSLNTFEKELKG